MCWPAGRNCAAWPRARLRCGAVRLRRVLPRINPAAPHRARIVARARLHGCDSGHGQAAAPAGECGVAPGRSRATGGSGRRWSARACAPDIQVGRGGGGLGRRVANGGVAAEAWISPARPLGLGDPRWGEVARAGSQDRHHGLIPAPPTPGAPAPQRRPHTRPCRPDAACGACTTRQTESPINRWGSCRTGGGGVIHR